MFALIDTNGATHIAIHVPMEGAEKSLPALARMLEENAVFIKQEWSGQAVCKPKMSINLGDELEYERSDSIIKVNASHSVIGEDFVIASPAVFVSNAAALKKKDDEISKLRTELAHVKNEVETLQGKIANLAAVTTASSEN